MKKITIAGIVIVLILAGAVGYYFASYYNNGNINIKVSDLPTMGVNAVYITFDEIALHGNKTGWTNFSFSPITINILGLTLNNSKSIGNFSVGAQKYTMLRIYIKSVVVKTLVGNVTLTLSSPYAFVNHPINISSHSTTSLVIEFNLQQCINMNAKVFTPYVGVFIQ